MIFVQKSNLCVISLDNDDTIINFDIIAGHLLVKPTNIVYCEKEGKLFGIISMGDILRAKQNKSTVVGINMSFTCLQGYRQMEAREIFLANSNINAIPVVNSNRELLGTYIRWSDVFYQYDFSVLKGNNYAHKMWQKYRKIAIVGVCNDVSEKAKLMERWRDFLCEMGIEVELIYDANIVELFETKDQIIFIDKDEWSSLRTLYRDIIGKELDWDKAKTLDDVVENVVGTVVEMTLEELMAKGVHVVTLQLKGTDKAFWKKKEKETNARFKAIGKRKDNVLYEEFRKSFFDDIYRYDYAAELSSYKYDVCVDDDLVLMLKDAKTRYYNVQRGERLTVGQPDEYNNTVYFFGPCFVFGMFVEDSNTMPSQLQKILNNNNIQSKVVNYGVFSSQLQLYQRICSTKIKKGDIIIVYDWQKEKFENIFTIDLLECLEQTDVSVEWYVDRPIHANHKILSLWALEIYNRLPKEWFYSEYVGKANVVDIKNMCPLETYIDRFFTDFQLHGTIGSIVVNCNPFTYGHRYLIEESLKRVDYLIVFVVEEDRSLFSFKERFAMVIEGTKDLENVIVVPSGPFILSQYTFPEYFVKLEDDELKKNVENDITLFATLIAPRLNIKYRFVGDEKADAVTRAYNEAMKKILPQNGVELIEIPRKLMDKGKAISGTHVRKKIEEDDWDEIRKLVPPTTINCLMRTISG